MKRRDSAGFTLIELLIVVAVIAIIAAIAVPGLLSARASGNEASAIASLRAINSSQVVYSNSCGNKLYAATLEVLGQPPAGGGVPFISPDLSAGTTVAKSGYTVTMSGTAVSSPPEPPCNGGQVATGYYATSSPLTAGTTGRRYFWTNVSGAIYQQRIAFSSTNEIQAPASDPAARPIY